MVCPEWGLWSVELDGLLRAVEDYGGPMAGLRGRMTTVAAGALVVCATATFGDGAERDRGGSPPGACRASTGLDQQRPRHRARERRRHPTFGPGSVATYLNGTLVPKGELLENYYATGHVSLDNYIAEISGQAPTPLTDSDCNLTGYSNVTPGTDDPNSATYPGQVDGNGCVYPAPTATTTGAPTIANQLDAVSPPNSVSPSLPGESMPRTWVTIRRETGE